MNKLSDTTLRNLKATDKPQKKFDGGGLYILITPAGGKLWQMAYRFEGKPRTLSFGSYPAVSLKMARQKREEAKEQLAEGRDPGAQKRAAKAAVRAETENAFEVIAREWFNKKSSVWVPKHSSKIIARLENDIFPIIGGKEISSITAPEILEALQRIEARGAIETAHRALQDCGQIFRYAIATGRAKRDPAADLRGALVPVKKRHFPTITEPAAIGELLRDIGDYSGNKTIKFALQILPYVFLRSFELRGGEWSEIDSEAKEWKIPAERMKKKEQPHIVPLCSQVLTLLEDLRTYTGHTKFLFPGAWSSSKTITDMALLNALRRMGYDRETMTIHGFRSMASTLLNEQGYNCDWIERQLAHGERDSVRAAYNYAQYLPERRRMMQEWANYLDKLRAGKDGQSTEPPPVAEGNESGNVLTFPGRR